MVTYMTIAFLPTMLIMIVISVLYYGLLTASKMQGTLGKKILGLKVVNEQGERVSVGQGIGRYFAYILSGIIFYIGFIMIAFGEKKACMTSFAKHVSCINNRKSLDANRHLDFVFFTIGRHAIYVALLHSHSNGPIRKTRSQRWLKTI